MKNHFHLKRFCSRIDSDHRPGQLMAKTLSVLLAIMLHQNVSAQKKLDIGIFLSPTYANRHLVSGPAFHTDEKPIISYDVGALITVLKKGEATVQTGLVYSRKGYNWGELYFTPKPKPVPIEILTYLSVPIRVTHPIAKSPVYFIAGVTNDILLSQKLKVRNPPTDGHTAGRTGDARKYNVGVTLGIGQELIKDQLFRLRVEPTFNYQLRAYVGDGFPGKRRLYTMGLTLIGQFNIGLN